MPRFIFLNLFIAVHTIVFGTCAIVAALLGAGPRFVHLNVAVPWARVILKVCGVKVSAEGLENIQENVPVIFMANHVSYFDIFALLARLPVDFRFIVKQELMGIPILGHAMKKAGYIGIERKDPRKALKSVQEAAKRIKNGASVLIFPEGTRSSDGALQSFKPGGFHLTLKSGCDIVPVTIIGSRDIVPKGSWIINRGSIRLVVSQPIPLRGYTKRDMGELMERVRRAMAVHVEP
jgi:1-acyl-sn-glycerol-3-phosphate acyltransferase